MPRRMILAVLLVVVFLSANVANATCSYYGCFESGGQVSCELMICPGGNCEDYTYSANCKVVCDGPGSGGGCWCDYRPYCMDV